MRDLVDCCPKAENVCGEDRTKAVAKCCQVFVGNNLIMEYDARSDDYAFTHAREYAERYNRGNLNAAYTKNKPA